MTFRAAVIGCGGISTMHASNYETSRHAELVATADISAEALERFTSAHPGVAAYTSYREMLEREQLDMVTVCTPASTHLAPSLAVAQSSVKALLIEKPMAMNLRDADAILQACRSGGVKVAVGHQLRYASCYRTARQLIQSGCIGAVERIWGICHSAPLQTNATHTIDLLRFLAGDGSVDWVMGSIAVSSHGVYEGFVQEDAGLGFFQFHDGPVALIESGDLHPNRGYHHIYLDGSDGQMELTRQGAPALVFRSEATGGQWQEPEYLPALNPVDDLCEAVINGTTPCSSGEQGRATLEIILALFESARSHQRVDLPLRNLENPLEQILSS